MTNGGNKVRLLCWMKIWREFKRENSFTLSKSCMETERFLFTVKSSLYLQLNWRTWPRSKGKSSCGYDAAFLPKCFSSGCETVCKKLFYLVQVALTKIPRNKAKICQETEFQSSEGHLFNFSWLLPDLASLLVVVQVRFASRSAYRVLVGNDLVINL